MAPLIRPRLALLATLLCAPGVLQADDGRWAIQVGSVLPAGGVRGWSGNGPGLALAILDSYRVNGRDALRIRLEFLETKGRSEAPQRLALPGGDSAALPAATANRFQSFSYGVEYAHRVGAGGAYLVAGVGAIQLMAAREGTLNLPAAAPASFDYTVNKLSPYLCAGLGVQVNRDWGLELRGQWSRFSGQTRTVDLAAAGFKEPGRATFEGFTAATVSLAVTFTFN